MRVMGNTGSARDASSLPFLHKHRQRPGGGHFHDNARGPADFLPEAPMTGKRNTYCSTRVNGREAREFSRPMPLTLSGSGSAGPTDRSID